FSEAHCVQVQGQISPSSEELEGLTKFTLRVFEDIFSKEFEATAADLPYFLAPSAQNHDSSFSAFTKEVIDWAAVRFVHQMEKIPYEGNEPENFFKEKLVTD